MCIGIPMQIQETGPGFALCKQGETLRRIDTLLVGELPAGTWVLTFLDTAREVISVEHARQISDALQALELAMQGHEQVDHLFADLVNREPELPEFLRSPINPKPSGE